MPRITAIKPQKKRGDIFNVYLDGRFAFSLVADLVVKKNLRVGKEISPSQVAALRKKSGFQKFLDRAYHYLSYRPRTKKELADYLAKKGVEKKVIIGIIDYLEEKKFLDDEEFARWWIRQRETFRPRGKKALWLELRRKGVGPQVIEKALAEEVDEFSLIQKALFQGRKKYRHLAGKERRQKLIAYLLRRGFSWEAIKEVFNKLALVDEKRKSG